MAINPVKIGGDLVVYGPGAVSYLKSVKGKKAAIFTTNSIVKNGYYDKAVGYLKEAGIDTVGFFEKELNPSFEFIRRGADFLLEHQPDVVIAIGGGTVMDATKIMNAVYENPHLETIDQMLEELDDLACKTKAKTIFIPTTAGSASEASKSGIITDSKSKRKIPLRNFNFMPDIAVLDPEITVTLPKHLTAETGMDALTHLVEAYVSRNANFLSDMFARPCAEDVIRTLPLAYENPTNLDYRGKMQVCAMAGGYSFSVAGLGLCHGIAHGIGANINIPHGLLNAMTLPHVVRFNSNCDKAREKYLSLAKACGEDDFAELVEKLCTRLDIPLRYKDVVDNDAFVEENLTYMAECAIKDSCSAANPVDLTVDAVKEIIRKAYYGK